VLAAVVTGGVTDARLQNYRKYFFNSNTAQASRSLYEWKQLLSPD